jgi:hypothetical protein
MNWLKVLHYTLTRNQAFAYIFTSWNNLICPQRARHTTSKLYALHAVSNAFNLCSLNSGLWLNTAFLTAMASLDSLRNYFEVSIFKFDSIPDQEQQDNFFVLVVRNKHVDDVVFFWFPCTVFLLFGSYRIKQNLNGHFSPSNNFVLPSIP